MGKKDFEGVPRDMCAIRLNVIQAVKQILEADIFLLIIKYSDKIRSEESLFHPPCLQRSAYKGGFGKCIKKGRSVRMYGRAYSHEIVRILPTWL